MFISEKFDSIYDDLNIIRNSNEFILYKSNLEDEYALSQIETLFERYALNKNGLTQVRLLSAEGMELVRVNKVDNQAIRVPKADLQGKSDRYYYLHALAASENQIYVSDFDLNIENGVIFVPYEPTIRFTLKIDDTEGKLLGLIVLNFDGEKFFSVISRYESLDISDIEIGILDYNNYWSLNNTNKNDYQYISVTVKSNQSDEMRNIFDEIVQKQGAPKQGAFNFENKYYQYKEIAELEKSKYLFEGKLFSRYFVSYFNVDKLIEHDHPFIHSSFIVQVIASLLTFIISYALIYLIGQKRRHNILLLTSAYITNNTREGILLLGKNKEILYCNSFFEDIYGYKLIEIQNKAIATLFNSGLAFNEASETDEIFNANVWNKTKRGNWLFFAWLSKKAKC
ncbi:MAG: hypothetical protein BGO41_03285 [Clostridiales bacterium 38-18]|nr:MAG: hypothetical protein BGO41_03285 [Clostridiales bacterium 38-18]